jgi:protein TonB
MFDTLVESSKQKKGRTRSFFAGITLLYGLIVLAGIVWTIYYFNPQMSDSAELTALLAPPPPPPPPPPPAPAVKQVIVKDVPTTFTPPKEPPKEIPKPTDVKSRPQVQAVAVNTGGVPGGTGVPGGVPGGVGGNDDPPPPPPPPPPKPEPKPEPTPPPIPKKLNISGGVLAGKATRKVQPPYPPIAKAARAQGAVQVAVEIDEDGNVTSASAVGGHPLLRDAAVQAARQWKFEATKLSGQAVKVSGVLTFNFTLQ